MTSFFNVEISSLKREKKNMIFSTFFQYNQKIIEKRNGWISTRWKQIVEKKLQSFKKKKIQQKAIALVLSMEEFIVGIVNIEINNVIVCFHLDAQCAGFGHFKWIPNWHILAKRIGALNWALIRLFICSRSFVRWFLSFIWSIMINAFNWMRTTPIWRSIVLFCDNSPNVWTKCCTKKSFSLSIRKLVCPFYLLKRRFIVQSKSSNPFVCVIIFFWFWFWCAQLLLPNKFGHWDNRLSQVLFTIVSTNVSSIWESLRWLSNGLVFRFESNTTLSQNRTHLDTYMLIYKRSRPELIEKLWYFF